MRGTICTGLETPLFSAVVTSERTSAHSARMCSVQGTRCNQIYPSRDENLGFLEHFEYSKHIQPVK